MTLRFAALGLVVPALLLGHHPPGNHTLGLSVSPYKIISSQHDVSVPVIVTNLSGGKVHVVTSFIQSSKAGKGCTTGKAPAWAHVSPASFTLARGARRHTTVVLSAPAGTHGGYGLIAVYRARAAVIHKTGLSASAGVGTRVLVNYGGKPPACIAAAPLPARHGVSLLAWAAVAGSVLVLALGTLAVILRRRRYSHPV